MSVRIVIPDDFPRVYAGQPELDQLRAIGDVSIYGDRSETRAELLGRLADAEIVVNVRAYTPFDDALFAALPQLRLVAIFGTGTDNFDLDAASRHGVVVANAPGANARSVAEQAIALMFAAARNLPAYDRDTRAGHWRHYEGMELEGKTLGVVGLGNIGQQIAHMGNGLGMRVLGWSLRRDEARAVAAGVELVEPGVLYRKSDVISLSIALSERTRGLIGARELSLMKPSAILINTARGPLIDEIALIEALRERRIRGAGLDVYTTEPVEGDNPLLALENVVLAPHAGWVTNEARKRLLAAPVQNIRNYLAGAPTSVVNPAALAHPKQAPLRAD